MWWCVVGGSSSSSSSPPTFDEENACDLITFDTESLAVTSQAGNRV